MVLGRNSCTPLPAPVRHHVFQNLKMTHPPNIVCHKLQPSLSLLPRIKPFSRAAAPKRHFVIVLTVSEIERI